jgi:hypothetical protein
MLFDRRLGRPAAQLLDIGGDRQGVDIMKFEAAVLAPVEELFHRARIGGARVAVTDAGGDEFDEAAAGALAAAADDGRQRLKSGADQRGRRCQRLGQQNRRLQHFKGSSRKPMGHTAAV